MPKRKGYRKKPNKKKIKGIVRSVLNSNIESKFYAYTPIATGTANTTGLKYLLNAMPWSRVSVTGGLVDNTGGMIGPGSSQMLGTDYLIKELFFRAQIVPNGANSVVCRFMIVREQSPEGTLIVTAPKSLLADQTVGISVISPQWAPNMINNGGHRFKVYVDKTMVISNNISANGVKRIVQFKKRFRNGVKVQTYPNPVIGTEGSTANITNILSNAFYALLIFDSTTQTVEQVQASLLFKDA